MPGLWFQNKNTTGGLAVSFVSEDKMTKKPPKANENLDMIQSYEDRTPERVRESQFGGSFVQPSSGYRRPRHISHWDSGSRD